MIKCHHQWVSNIRVRSIKQDTYQDTLKWLSKIPCKSPTFADTQMVKEKKKPSSAQWYIAKNTIFISQHRYTLNQFANLAVPSCSVIRSSSSCPTGAPHIGRSTGAWISQYQEQARPAHSPKLNLNSSTRNKIKGSSWQWPSDSSVYRATLRRSVSRHSPPSPLHLGHATIDSTSHGTDVVTILVGFARSSDVVSTALLR